MSGFNGYQPFSGGASVLNDGTLWGSSSSGLQNSRLNLPTTLGFHPPCYDHPVEEVDIILDPLALKHPSSAGPFLSDRVLDNFCKRHLGVKHYRVNKGVYKVSQQLELVENW
jgi:hypothetical protein